MLRVEDWWQDSDIFGFRPLVEIKNGGEGSSISLGAWLAIHAEKDVLSHTWLCGHTERRDVVAGFSWACSCCLLATLLVSAVPLSCATLRQGQSTIRV